MLDGELIDILPMGADDIARCKPVYETMPGWTDSTVGVTQYDKLPVKRPPVPAAHRSKPPVCPSTWCPPARTATTPS
jgi:adenylosuccinate synthase